MTRQQVRTAQTRTVQTRTTRTGDRQTDRRQAYVEGNTVRKLNAVPRRLPDERERREQERRRQVDRRTRLNRERALRMNPAYLLFLTLAVAMTVGVCGVYIKLQTELSARKSHVASLESQIQELRTDNDAAWNRIETSVDLQAVKDTAMNSLGMVYPTQDQVIYYEVDNDDYMNQYQDIPEE